MPNLWMRFIFLISPDEASQKDIRCWWAASRCGLPSTPQIIIIFGDCLMLPSPLEWIWLEIKRGRHYHIFQFHLWTKGQGGLQRKWNQNWSSLKWRAEWKNEERERERERESHHSTIQIHLQRHVFICWLIFCATQFDVQPHNGANVPSKILIKIRMSWN